MFTVIASWKHVLIRIVFYLFDGVRFYARFTWNNINNIQRSLTKHKYNTNTNTNTNTSYKYYYLILILKRRSCIMQRSISEKKALGPVAYMSALIYVYIYIYIHIICLCIYMYIHYNDIHIWKHVYICMYIYIYIYIHIHNIYI